MAVRSISESIVRHKVANTPSLTEVFTEILYTYLLVESKSLLCGTTQLLFNKYKMLLIIGHSIFDSYTF